ncbi:hypothetical protein K469DRAFT_689273 [Zopfia rhizophila CBS 207.26]|uniref:Uncharacterized protein n=1 Tax=Zopfia rhizophila CBS 207.26 TaxID=1314779 RepID=A0A6A6EVY1_9PEZI|nr:hypothetical protein K469DRAFT_689273 [Zopfia rhizophila CBS 207.26]
MGSGRNGRSGSDPESGSRNRNNRHHMSTGIMSGAEYAYNDSPPQARVSPFGAARVRNARRNSRESLVNQERASTQPSSREHTTYEQHATPKSPREHRIRYNNAGQTSARPHAHLRRGLLLSVGLSPTFFADNHLVIESFDPSNVNELRADFESVKRSVNDLLQAAQGNFNAGYHTEAREFLAQAIYEIDDYQAHALKVFQRDSDKFTG